MQEKYSRCVRESSLPMRLALPCQQGRNRDENIFLQKFRIPPGVSVLSAKHASLRSLLNSELSASF
jgi:hypothetical protein